MGDIHAGCGGRWSYVSYAGGNWQCSRCACFAHSVPAPAERFCRCGHELQEHRDGCLVGWTVGKKHPGCHCAGFVDGHPPAEQFALAAAAPVEQLQASSVEKLAAGAMRRSDDRLSLRLPLRISGTQFPCTVVDAGGAIVAVTNSSEIAHLVAAAPQMLDELEELRALFAGCRSVELFRGEDAQRWAAQLGELIDRAKGGER